MDYTAIRDLALSSFGYLPHYKPSLVRRIRAVANEAVKLGMVKEVRYDRYVGYDYDEGGYNLPTMAALIGKALEHNEVAKEAARGYRNLLHVWSDGIRDWHLGVGVAYSAAIGYEEEREAVPDIGTAKSDEGAYELALDYYKRRHDTVPKPSEQVLELGRKRAEERRVKTLGGIDCPIVRSFAEGLMFANHHRLYATHDSVGFTLEPRKRMATISVFEGTKWLIKGTGEGDLFGEGRFTKQDVGFILRQLDKH